MKKNVEYCYIAARRDGLSKEQTLRFLGIIHDTLRLCLAQLWIYNISTMFTLYKQKYIIHKKHVRASIFLAYSLQIEVNSPIRESSSMTNVMAAFNTMDFFNVVCVI